MSGTVSIVATGFEGAWTLHGPTGTQTGTGDSTLLTQPTGAYWIEWTAEAGYITPVNDYGDLAEAATLELTGTYTPTTQTTPDGFLSVPVDMLRTIISECATFQAWTGNPGNAASAISYIFPFGVADPDTESVQCVVTYTDGTRFWKVGGGEGNVYNVQGNLRAYFTAPIDGSLIDTESAAAYDFANRMGNIMEEIQDLSDVSGRINLVSMSLPEPPARCAYEIEGGKVENYFEMMIDFEYSIQ